MNFTAILQGDGETALRQIGESLRVYRANLVAVSQEEMARRIGVSRSTYIRMESGDPRVPLGCWIGAWRRLYLDRRHDLSVLTGMLALLDPTEPLARAQTQEAQEIMQRRQGDIASDIERQMASVMEWYQRNGHTPRDPEDDDLEESATPSVPIPDEGGPVIGPDPFLAKRERLQEITEIASLTSRHCRPNGWSADNEPPAAPAGGNAPSSGE